MRKNKSLIQINGANIAGFVDSAAHTVNTDHQFFFVFFKIQIILTENIVITHYTALNLI